MAMYANSVAKKVIKKSYDWLFDRIIKDYKLSYIHSSRNFYCPEQKILIDYKEMAEILREDFIYKSKLKLNGSTLRRLVHLVIDDIHENSILLAKTNPEKFTMRKTIEVETGSSVLSQDIKQISGNQMACSSANFPQPEPLSCLSGFDFRAQVEPRLASERRKVSPNHSLGSQASREKSSNPAFVNPALP